MSHKGQRRRLERRLETRGSVSQEEMEEQRVEMLGIARGAIQALEDRVPACVLYQEVLADHEGDDRMLAQVRWLVFGFWCVNVGAAEALEGYFDRDSTIEIIHAYMLQHIEDLLGPDEDGALAGVMTRAFEEFRTAYYDNEHGPLYRLSQIASGWVIGNNWDGRSASKPDDWVSEARRITGPMDMFMDLYYSTRLAFAEGRFERRTVRRELRDRERRVAPLRKQLDRALADLSDAQGA